MDQPELSWGNVSFSWPLSRWTEACLEEPVAREPFRFSSGKRHYAKPCGLSRACNPPANRSRELTPTPLGCTFWPSVQRIVGRPQQLSRGPLGPPGAQNVASCVQPSSHWAFATGLLKRPPAIRACLLYRTADQVEDFHRRMANPRSTPETARKVYVGQGGRGHVEVENKYHCVGRALVAALPENGGQEQPRCAMFSKTTFTTSANCQQSWQGPHDQNSS